MSFTSVEVCAGAGGQALGLEQAGFEHLACVELDPHACATLQLNRPDWKVIPEDLREWQPKKHLAVPQDLDLLAGGVPCPPFSAAGKQLGRDDERDLFPEMVRLTRELQPRAVMIENVRGILARRFDDYRHELLKEFQDIGYVSCGWNLLNAADFGVPQARRRAILVLMREDIAARSRFDWPEAAGPATTVAEALSPFLDGWAGFAEWAKGADAVAPALVGGSKKHGGADVGPTRAKLAWRNLGVDGMGIANDQDPMPASGDRIRLTVGMAAAIQGFPPDWKFAGRKTAAYRQVGNAFPPPVAAAVGRSIASALTEAEAVDEDVA